MRYLIIIFLLGLSTISCDLSSPEEVDEAEIKEILQGIENTFIFEDESAIMNFYHPQFLHGTDTFNAELIIWAIRQNEYNVMTITDINVDLNDNFATVSFTLTFDDLTTFEPSEQNGDMSYFYREYDDWKICGNNFTQP